MGLCALACSSEHGSHSGENTAGNAGSSGPGASAGAGGSAGRSASNRAGTGGAVDAVERPPGEQTPLGTGANCVLNGIAEGDRGSKLEVGECEQRSLPSTGATYCILATPACSTAGAGCPLYIVSNMAAFHDRVAYPAAYGALISVKINPDQITRDSLAELPRQLAKDYEGMDTRRVYAMGWSIGGHNMKVALMKSKEGFDTQYGSLLGLYTGFASMGISVEATENYAPVGRFHVIQIAGAEDPFAMNGADPSGLAGKHGCSNATLSWTSVAADDPLMVGNGTDAAEKATFGDCPGGDVIAYRFKDHGHDLKFDKHFDPAVRALNIAWNFFQGRTTDESSFTGSGAGCVTR